jgi:hypothetical protein
LKGVGCTSPGSSVVVVTSLLEGVAWYAKLIVLRAWWNSPKGATIVDQHRFRRPDHLGITFFSFFSFLFLCFFLLLFLG